MLVEFKFQNYKSFRDAQSLSMVTGSDKTLIENTFDTPAVPTKRLVRSSVLYGPNASGKSNLIDALHFVRRFVQHSSERNPEAKIPVQPFLLDKQYAQQPSEFELTFIHKNVRYQYGFSLDSDRVYEEWLLAYPKRSAQTWFERSWNKESEDYDWYFGPFLKGEKNKLSPLTRPNVLFLSVAANFNHEQLSKVYQWFTHHLRVLQHDNFGFLEFATSKLIEKNSELFPQVKELLSVADLGIVDFSLEILPLTTMLSEIPAEMPEDVKNVLAALTSTMKNEERIQISMQHQAGDSNVSGVPLTLENESLGTRRLFGLSGPLLMALQRGEVLAVDELDASLHPVLVRTLVNLFHNPKTNPKNAQLIFNTHDTTLLDSAIFRRDQIWFTEKDHSGASHLYSLLEFKPRSSEAFGKGYLQGRYGAIPIVGSLEGIIENGPDT